MVGIDRDAIPWIGDIDNLVAQNKQINRSGGEWYNMEKEWANALELAS